MKHFYFVTYIGFVETLGYRSVQCGSVETGLDFPITKLDQIRDIETELGKLKGMFSDIKVTNYILLRTEPAEPTTSETMGYSPSKQEARIVGDATHTRNIEADLQKTLDYFTDMEMKHGGMDVYVSMDITLLNGKEIPFNLESIEDGILHGYGKKHQSMKIPISSISYYTIRSTQSSDLRDD